MPSRERHNFTISSAKRRNLAFAQRADAEALGDADAAVLHLLEKFQHSGVCADRVQLQQRVVRAYDQRHFFFSCLLLNSYGELEVVALRAILEQVSHGVRAQGRHADDGVEGLGLPVRVARNAEELRDGERWHLEPEIAHLLELLDHGCDHAVFQEALDRQRQPSGAHAHTAGGHLGGDLGHAPLVARGGEAPEEDLVGLQRGGDQELMTESPR